MSTSVPHQQIWWVRGRFYFWRIFILQKNYRA